MIEQDKLLECLEEIKGIAAVAQGRLTTEEVQKYLDGMGMSDQQMNAVYQYLVSQGIHVDGYDGVPEPSPVPTSAGRGRQTAKQSGRAGKKVSSSGSAKTKAQRNLLLYQKEVEALSVGGSEEGFQKMKDYLRGETALREEILYGLLPFVIQIAERYKKKGVPEEEIIAEGNLGLMKAVTGMESHREMFLRPDGEPDVELAYDRIEREIRHGIEEMIDWHNENKDRENTIVARTNLLHEASKYLAEEMGRVASREELAEYTKIPLQEINDMMRLSEDIRKVAGN